MQLAQIENPRHLFAKSFEESNKLAEEERQTTIKDNEAQVEKRKFLSQFRDENKMVRKVLPSLIYTNYNVRSNFLYSD